MKRVWKSAVAVAMAAAMTVNTVPAFAQAKSVREMSTDSLVKTMKENLKKSSFGNSFGKDTEKNYVEGEAIVLYKNTSSKMKASSAGDLFGKNITVEGTYEFVGEQKKGTVTKKSTAKNKGFSISLVKSDKYSTNELIRRLKQMDDVQTAEPNYVYHMMDSQKDAYSKHLWGLDNQGQNGGTEDADIHLDSVKKPESDNKERVIAIVDTGVDYNHEDLQGIMWENPYTDRLKGKYGYDFSNGDTDPMDDNGHGTHCTGIMAANADNGIGVKGVASDPNVKIMALKVLDAEGICTGFETIGAYNYIYRAQQLGVNVVAINNSWGGYTIEGDESTSILEELINLTGEKGALSVCAAGNESYDMDELEKSSIKEFPAGIDSPYIISVAASTGKEELASFSNYGKKNADIAAPGDSILSTVCDDTFTPELYDEEEKMCAVYEDFSGSLKLVTGAALATAKSENDTAVYGLDDDEKLLKKQEVTLNKEDKYFGTKGGDKQSLKWSIKDAKEGEIYQLYLPYYQEVSKTPVHLSMMLSMAGKTKKKLTDEDSPSVLAFFDEEVQEDGTIECDIIDMATSMLGASYIQQETANTWGQITGKIADKAKKAGQRALVFYMMITADGDYEVNIDDFAISKSNVEEEKFGKYAFYGGTSMAAPYVTGSVALTSILYPNESPEELRARILGSARKTESLKDKVAMGGSLDFANIDTPRAFLEDVLVNEQGNLEIKGYFFKNPSVAINGENPQVIESTKEKIVLKGDFYNKNLNIQIDSNGTKLEDTVYFTNGTAFEKTALFDSTFLTSKGNVVSDGNVMYYVSDSGTVCSYNPNQAIPPYGNGSLQGLGTQGTELDPATGGTNLRFDTLNMMCAFCNPTEIFGKEALVGNIVLETYPVVYDGKIYSVISADFGYAKEAVLAACNIEKGAWEKVCNIPGDNADLNKIDSYYNMIAPTLGVYEGKLYLLGGYNHDNKKASASVYEYDIENNKWSKKADLPEGRYGAKAFQVKDKLVVTLGGNGSETVPANLIFDGSKWTESKAKLNPVKPQNLTYQLMNEENAENAVSSEIGKISSYSIPCYTAQVGQVKEGLVYTNLKTDGMGDTFLYDMKEDNYKSSGYSVQKGYEDKEIYATTIGDQLYAIYTKPFSLNLDDLLTMDAKEEGDEETGKQEDTEFDQSLDSEMAIVAAMPVSSAAVQIVNVSENPIAGMVIGTGNYLPGTTAVIGAVANEDYFLKSFTVNGQKVDGDTYQVKINSEMEDIQVNAEFGAYVSGLYIDAGEKLTITEGSKLKLKACISPEVVDNGAIEWTSDNKKVAIVDKNGVVTAKTASYKPVTITATAKDRGTVTATYQLVVTKKTNTPEKEVKVKKITLKASKKKLKAGKKMTIKAAVTPSNAANKSLKWSTSNKKYATVTQKGKVTAKKAGIGKTVKITATAKDGSKIKGTIKIKVVK